MSFDRRRRPTCRRSGPRTRAPRERRRNRNGTSAERGPVARLRGEQQVVVDAPRRRELIRGRDLDALGPPQIARRCEGQHHSADERSAYPPSLLNASHIRSTASKKSPALTESAPGSAPLYRCELCGLVAAEREHRPHPRFVPRVRVDHEPVFDTQQPARSGWQRTDRRRRARAALADTQLAADWFVNDGGWSGPSEDRRHARPPPAIALTSTTPSPTVTRRTRTRRCRRPSEIEVQRGIDESDVVDSGQSSSSSGGASDNLLGWV